MIRHEVLQVAKSILLDAEPIRLILNNKKTVIRGIVKPQPANNNDIIYKHEECGKWFISPDDISCPETEVKMPYQVGDYLYVRETWCRSYKYFYKADGEEIDIPTLDGGVLNFGKADGLKWRPSIHMPKEAARIFLRVTGVRVERLQDITADDCISEGVDAEIPPICKRNPPTEEQQRKYDNMTAEQQERYIHELAKHTYMGWCVYGDRLCAAFRKLWNSTVKKSDLDKYGWDANPWVWVIEFERVEME